MLLTTMVQLHQLEIFLMFLEEQPQQQQVVLEETEAVATVVLIPNGDVLKDGIKQGA